MSLDLLAHRTRPAAQAPEGALVLAHGRGADENDLAPLADALDPGRRLAAYLPRGPLSLPPGGEHWYVVRRVGFPDPETFWPSYERLSAWVDAVVADANVPPDRLVLAGFSQGAVMSYALGLAVGRPRPGAVLAFSGFIPEVEGLELDLESRAGLPVSITHGTLDPMIGVELGQSARERLGAAGLDVRYREEPVGHTITAAALAQAQRVLESVL